MRDPFVFSAIGLDTLRSCNEFSQPNPVPKTKGNFEIGAAQPSRLCKAPCSKYGCGRLSSAVFVIRILEKWGKGGRDLRQQKVSVQVRTGQTGATETRGLHREPLQPLA